MKVKTIRVEGGPEVHINPNEGNEWTARSMEEVRGLDLRELARRMLAEAVRLERAGKSGHKRKGKR